MTSRKCLLCGEAKADAEFEPQRNGRPSNWCRLCKKEWDADWRARNRERRCAESRARYRAIRDTPEYQEKRRRWQANWRAANPERERAKRKEWRLANPDKIRRHARRALLKSLYGLTLEQFEGLLAEQGSRCAICHGTFVLEGRREKMAPVVDHCHKTGFVRGLLCVDCNFGLGRFADDRKRLRRAVAYLQKGAAPFTLPDSQNSHPQHK